MKQSVFKNREFPWADVGTSMALAMVGAMLSLVAPACFRILIDTVVPLQDGWSFVEIMSVAAGSLLAAAYCRASIKFFQSAARDKVESMLLRFSTDRLIESSQQLDPKIRDSLSVLPAADIRRVAEFYGNEPGQLTSGIAHLLLLITVLTANFGIQASLVFLVLLALRLIDAKLLQRELRGIIARSKVMERILGLHSRIAAAWNTIGGLELQAETRKVSQSRFRALGLVTEKLRRVQRFNDSMRYGISEVSYVMSFVVASIFMFNQQITAGTFVFLVTLILQMDTPIFLILDAYGEWKKTSGMRSSLVKRLSGRDEMQAEVLKVRLTPIHLTPGTLCLLTGKSGAGKTRYLTAKAIGMRNLQQRSKPGCIYLPQDPIAPPLTPRQLLEAVKSQPNFGTHAKKLGIGKLICQPRDLNSFSGGELRRIFMLKVMNSSHAVALLDEPDAGLDDDARKAMIDALHESTFENQRSVVLISHQFADYSQLKNSHSIDISALIDRKEVA